jgi:hypothetical protein
MSGKVPVSYRTQIRKAAEKFRDFTGHDPEPIGRVNIDIPKAASVIGELEAVIYSTVRDGKNERYIHRFKKASRALLCVSPDGKQLLIVGGNYEFTERGIEDA